MTYTDYIRFYEEGVAAVDPITGILTPGRDKTIWEGYADLQDGVYALLRNTEGDVVLDADARIFLPTHAPVPITGTLVEAGGQKGRVASSSRFNREAYVKWR